MLPLLCLQGLPFQLYPRPSCDRFTLGSGNIERYLTTWKERFSDSFSKNMFERREAILELLDAFDMPYNNMQKIFKMMVYFDFKPVCWKDETYRKKNYLDWVNIFHLWLECHPIFRMLLLARTKITNVIFWGISLMLCRTWLNKKKQKTRKCLHFDTENEYWLRRSSELSIDVAEKKTASRIWICSKFNVMTCKADLATENCITLLIVEFSSAKRNINMIRRN